MLVEFFHLSLRLLFPFRDITKLLLRVLLKFTRFHQMSKIVILVVLLLVRVESLAMSYERKILVERGMRTQSNVKLKKKRNIESASMLEKKKSGGNFASNEPHLGQVGDLHSRAATSSSIRCLKLSLSRVWVILVSEALDFDHETPAPRLTGPHWAHSPPKK
jgi:hypothetical protein